ncbi:acyl-CoA dehydrogenase family protein [Nonomuraea sp. NPDC046570]|uniref:acyl-CoA dehydrogenase family protein n=1 Tax=Nonomuraea sp. NPDC046570 TaxID=3155255 RepID=UPI0033C70C40
MDYRDSAEQAAFRASLREWLAEHAPRNYGEATDEIRRDWHQKLYEAGYVGMSWPKEYGGRGLNPIYDAIFNEETGLADCPPVPGFVNYIGRTVFTYASEEQKQQYLPKLLSGEVQWCQGFSEPGAGSDLAALRTKAELRDGVWVVNGQKMWTSGGEHADWCLLLARTDPDAPKHKGISCFLMDMRSTGVTVRPIVLSDGEPETSEVFLDNVEIPAAQLLGDQGAGWRIAMTAVSYERGPADVGMISWFRKELAATEQEARERGVDEETRRRLAWAYVTGEAMRLNVAQQLSHRVAGRPVGVEGSVAKVLWSQAWQNLTHLELDIAGADTLTGRQPAWLANYFRSRPASVYGGSSQIQRNLIAWHLLGLPR